jgi:hypothetical protein
MRTGQIEGWEPKATSEEKEIDTSGGEKVDITDPAPRQEPDRDFAGTADNVEGAERNGRCPTTPSTKSDGTAVPEEAPDASRFATPATPGYFDVDVTLDRRARPGRGTRSNKFHEEFGFEALIPRTTVPGEILACAATDVSIMSATSDPDTMYFHQAMQQEDAPDFLGAAHKEFQNLIERDVIEIIPKHLAPNGAKVFAAVWSMKRKRRVRTREIYKYKARLNLDGSQMQPGRDYDATYAPVASWESVRTLLSLVLHRKWKTKQLP